MGERGFGFIRPDDVTRGSEEVFVHLSQLRLAGINKPQTGAVLVFEVGEHNGRPSAINIERVVPRAKADEDAEW
jgi:cold shock CspA family protein